MARPALTCAVLLALPALPVGAQQLSLVDISDEIGVVNPSFGRGAAAVDLDGDGLEDLVAANAGQPSVFLHQRPDHSFEPVNQAWGIPADPWASWAIVVTDLDGDGDPDCFFGNGGFTESQPNQLLRNDLATLGVFSDVSATSGDALISSNVFGATGLDYDNDGDVDVYMSGQSDRNLLLRNDGGLYFTDVADAAGLGEIANLRHTSSGDYDNDGWVDIGVGHYNGFNRLYRNDADGSFTDVAEAAGLTMQEFMFGFVFEDFDNDGWLDIYLPSYRLIGDDVGDHLLLNNGDGTFRDLAPTLGFPQSTSMGHNTGDIDGDGYPDIFIGTGGPTYIGEDVLLLVQPDGQGGVMITDVTVSAGIAAVGDTRGHGSAFFDYEDDGDINLYTNNGGPEFLPETLEDDSLFQNQGPAGPWATLELRGVLSNRGALHARASLQTSAGRAIRRTVTAGKGFGNTDSPVLHFPLQPGEQPTRLDVRWPSGIVQYDWWPTAGSYAWIETGLRTVDQQLPGVITTLQVAGPPLALADLLLGLDSAHIPLPAHGGVLQVYPLLAPLLTVPLDANGTLSVPIPVVGDPLLEGLGLRIQALVRGAGSDKLLTNTVVVVLE